jgi:hypothetical protein
MTPCLPAGQRTSAPGNGASAAARGTAFLIVLGLVIACASVWIAQTRTYTYVSGQDPMTYMHLARQFLGSAPHDSTTSGGLVAPGYPVMLAVVISVFGPLAPYWTNAVLAILGILLLWRLLTLLAGDRFSALIAVLTCMIVVVAGCPNNVHFLLYPFRETPGLLVLGLALLLFLAGMRSASPGRQWAFGTSSACVALLACAIRETAIVGFGGILLYAVVVPSVRRTCWRVPAAFFAVLTAALAAVLLVFGRAALSDQWRVVPALAGQFGIRGFMNRFMFNEQAMRALLVQELGWAGLCLLAIGLLTARRHATLVVATAIPAVGWHICHAIHEAHPRYALYTLLCLGAIAGMGFASLLGILNRGRGDCPQVPAPAKARALPVAMVLTLCATILTEVYLLHPWGARVRLSQLEAFHAAMAKAPSGTSSVLLTPADRYVLDAVFSHTALRVVTWETANPQSLQNRPTLAVTALNRQARFRGGYSPYAGVLAPAILAHYAKVEQVLDDSGQPVRFKLDDGEYELLCSTPWTQTVYSANLPVKPDSDTVIWFDFGHSPPGADRSVTVTPVAGEDPSATFTTVRKGLVPLLVPRAVAASGGIRLTVRSNTPFPDNPLFSIQRRSEPVSFCLDDNRTLSIHEWFRGGFCGVTPAAKYGAMMVGTGSIHVPAPSHSDGLRLDLAAQIGAPIHKADTPIDLSVAVNDTLSTNWVIRKDDTSWHGFSVTNLSSSDTARVDLNTSAKRRRDVLRFYRILICYSSPETP